MSRVYNALCTLRRAAEKAACDHIPLVARVMALGASAASGALSATLKARWKAFSAAAPRAETAQDLRTMKPLVLRREDGVKKANEIRQAHVSQPPTA